MKDSKELTVTVYANNKNEVTLYLLTHDGKYNKHIYEVTYYKILDLVVITKLLLYNSTQLNNKIRYITKKYTKLNYVFNVTEQDLIEQLREEMLQIFRTDIYNYFTRGEL